MLYQTVSLQTLDVAADSEALALALQPHIAEINRRRFLPTIARVLEEFDRADEHIQIARLDVDLGDVPAADFERTADASLSLALRQAIEEALRDARETPSVGRRVRSESASRFELFEYYLLWGTLPFWAKAEGFSIDALVSDLARRDPGGLVAVIGRLARDRRALERLALQLEGPALERLLRLLAPEHAALILAYMSDLRQANRIVPLAAVGEANFAQRLWMFVLTYLLRDPGTQFNRKSFVRSLIDDIADRDGVDHHELLRILQRGLRETQRRQSLASSLPAIVAELIRDRPAAGRAESSASDDRSRAHDAAEFAISRLDLLALALARGAAASSGTGPSISHLVDLLLSDDPEGLKALLHRHERRQQVVRHLVESLGDPVLQRLLAVIDAPHADLIVAYLVALRDVHRRDVLLKWSDERFARLLWFLVLTYVLRDPGTPFNRKSFVRSLLTGIADREIVGYVDLLVTLQRGLRLTKLEPSSASLLAVIDDLADEIDLSAGQGAAADAAADPLARLAHYLTTGRMPKGEGSDPRELFHQAVARDAAGAALLLWRLAHSPSGRSVLIDRLASHIDGREAAALFEGTAGTSRSGLAHEGGRGTNVSDGVSDATDQRDAWARVLESLGAGSVRVADRASDASGSEGHAANERPRRETADGDASIGSPAQDIAFYDAVEISRAVLRHGVVPWRMRLRDAGATVDRVLTQLSELSPACLRRVFAGRPDDRLQLAERAMRQLPELRIQAMLARLITQAPGDPFRSALASFAREARSKPAFYARAVLALLDQTPLDLEQAAAETASIAAAPVRSDDPAQWDGARLRSELVGKLTSGMSLGDEPPVGTILRALVSREGGEAARFLSAVSDWPGGLSSLVRQVAPELLRSIVDTLYPAEAAMAHSTLDALAPALPHGLSEHRRHALAITLMFDLLHGPPFEAFARMLRDAGLAASREGPPPRPTPRGSADLPAIYVAAYEAAWARSPIDGVKTNPAETKTASGPSPRLREAAIDWLQGAPAQRVAATHRPDALAPLARDLLAHTIERLIAAEPASIADPIRRAAADREQRERWASTLPEPTLVRLMSVIAPGRRYWLLPLAETLVAAWRDVAPAGRRPVADRTLLWTFLFEMVGAEGDLLTADRFVTAFVARTAAADQALASRLIDRAGVLTRTAGHAWLQPALARGGSPPGTDGALHEGMAPPARTRRRPDRGKTAFSLPSDEDEGGTPIYIDNAGLILAGPFLPHLFQTLDLLDRDERGRQRLRDRDCVSRAAHLLQWLVDGRSDTPEPRLALNKVLSGVPVQAPVSRMIEATDAELLLCERLLQAMIGSWTIIAKTSIAGLRETFLQREGKLQRTDDGWKLQVQRKTVDVLVDQVPWNHTILFPSWMPQPLHVTW